MYPFDKDNIFRKISIKLLFPLFYRSKLSANKITVLNFLTLGLLSLILFITGREILGLLTAGLMAMVDYIDGEIARARGSNTKLGQYLDTSLDWLYLMLLIGAISYYHRIMPIGYLALMAITYANWLQYAEDVNCILKFPFGISYLLVGSIILGQTKWGIISIGITQWYRLIIMYIKTWKEKYGTHPKISHNCSS